MTNAEIADKVFDLLRTPGLSKNDARAIIYNAILDAFERGFERGELEGFLNAPTPTER